MKLQYRIGKLELDNMELEQSRIVHESAMRGKDLTIQKLQLQVTLASFAWSIERIRHRKQRVKSQRTLSDRNKPSNTPPNDSVAHRGRRQVAKCYREHSAKLCNLSFSYCFLCEPRSLPNSLFWRPSCFRTWSTPAGGARQDDRSPAVGAPRAWTRQ